MNSYAFSVKKKPFLGYIFFPQDQVLDLSRNACKKSPSLRSYWITPCALLECQVAEKSRKLKPTTILFFYKGKIFETTDAQLCCVDQADKGKKIGLCTETTLTTLSCIFFCICTSSIFAHTRIKTMHTSVVMKFLFHILIIT